MYKAERTTLTDKALGGRPLKKRATAGDKPSQVVFILPVKDGETVSEAFHTPSTAVRTTILKFDPVKAAHEGADLRMLDLMHWYTQNLPLLSQNRRAQLRGMLGDAVAILCREYPQKMSAGKMLRIRVALGSDWIDARLSDAGLNPATFPSTTT